MCFSALYVGVFGVSIHSVLVCQCVGLFVGLEVRVKRIQSIVQSDAEFSVLFKCFITT